MYDLCDAAQSAINKPTTQQMNEIANLEQYLKQHKIHELYNQMLAKLIQTKPDNVKQQMINILKKIKQKQYYFKKPDFESMFEAYDIFENKGTNQINYLYIIQALSKLNIIYEKEVFLNKYPQFKLEKEMKKSDFVAIMQKQYKEKISF